MRKNALLLAVALAVYEFPAVLFAQTDSSRYDIGYVTLNRAFTQHVTIRGEDLEKMPSANLSEAIRAWLFGAYTIPTAVAYVVDGNPVADVNIYSIYDIESVTWIANAVGTAAYGNTQRELVLVSTRRGKGASGMRVAAQTGFVKEDVQPGARSNTIWYHQYYVNAFENLDKVSFGVSANWLRDVQPELYDANAQVQIPDNLQRWRFNGWLDWRPDAENTISLRMGYVPQKVESKFVEPSGGPYMEAGAIQSHFTVPRLSWEGRWLPGLKNRLDAEYLHSGRDANQSNTSVYNNVTSVDGSEQAIASNHILVRDHLSYTAKAGKWQLIPAIDISYHRIDEKYSFIQYQADGATISYSDSSEQKSGFLYLTPAMNLTLARTLDVNAGVLVNASSKVDSSNRRFFPFVTATVDMLHLGKQTGAAGLKVFGSYASRPNLYIDDYSLPDFEGGGGSQSLFNILYGAPGYNFINGVGVRANFDMVQPACWTWQTGIEYSSASGLVTLQYSYERRRFSFLSADSVGNYYFEPLTASFHRADVRVKILDGKGVRWLSGINVSLLRSKESLTNVYPQFPIAPIGDVYPAKYSWTGGWVNRLTLGAFTAGLDIVYHRNLTSMVGYPKNATAVPNVYAGYKFMLPGARQLEIFIESRGLVMNRFSDVADGRRYYTVGGNFSL